MCPKLMRSCEKFPDLEDFRNQLGHTIQKIKAFECKMLCVLITINAHFVELSSSLDDR